MTRLDDGETEMRRMRELEGKQRGGELNKLEVLAQR